MRGGSSEPARPAREVPGRWCRGDFHVHTNLSDGRYPQPEVARLCREHGLDFFAITDHNALGPLTDFGEEPGVLIIAGLEVTLEEGHWNVLGIDGPQPWMDDVCLGKISIPLSSRYSGTSELLAQTRTAGALNSMNHPCLPPWEWRDLQTDMRLIDAIEVWNDPLWPDNDQATPRAVRFWSECLQAGLRPTAVGGSDFHVLPGEADPYPGERPGLPVTMVHAAELSVPAILEGVRSHRAWVSLGPTMDLFAVADGVRFEMGEGLGERAGRAAVTASVSEGPQTGMLRLLGDSGMMGEAALVGGAAEVRGELDLHGDRPRWARAEVLDGRGQLRALTNPVFAGPRLSPERLTFGEIARRAGL